MQQIPPDRPKGKDTGDHLRRTAVDFIRANRAAALATAGADGTPHASIVYCIIDDDLRLYFSTRVESRKFENLMSRRSVAMAFYNEPRIQMIQLTGRTRRVEDLEREQEIMGQLMKLRYGDANWPLPTVQLFHRGTTNEIAIIEVKPGEMTFADFSAPASGRQRPIFQKIV